MRGFLIFLALAFPVVLLSPSFWSLVNMEFGAERVGYVRAGNVTQWATLGPKAPWPPWALVPQGARLKVSSNFEAAPGLIATGFGDVDADDPPSIIARRYHDALAREKWTVTTFRFDATFPDIPPRPIKNCIVEGRQGARVQRLTLEMTDPTARGSLWWADGSAPPLQGARTEPCWQE